MEDVKADTENAREEKGDIEGLIAYNLSLCKIRDKKKRINWGETRGFQEGEQWLLREAEEDCKCCGLIDIYSFLL